MNFSRYTKLSSRAQIKYACLTESNYFPDVIKVKRELFNKVLNVNETGAKFAFVQNNTIFIDDRVDDVRYVAALLYFIAYIMFKFNNKVQVLGRAVKFAQDLGFFKVEKYLNRCLDLYNLASSKSRLDTNIGSFSQPEENIMSKIAVVCNQNFIGLKRMFEHLQSKFPIFISMTVEEVQSKLPDKIIFGGWHPDYGALLNDFPQLDNIYFSVSSSATQIDLSPGNVEHMQLLGLFKWIQEKPTMKGILVQDKGLYNALAHLDKVYYFPCTFNADLVKSNAVTDPNRINLYVPCYGRKNILSQLMAMSILRQKHNRNNLILYVNGLSKHYKDIMDLMDIRYIDEGKIPENEMYDKLKSAAINMQVTLAESFGYTVYESIALGAPCIFSTAVSIPSTLDTDNWCVSADNPDDIAFVMDSILSMTSDEKMARINNIRQSLTVYSKSNELAINKTINEVLQ